MLKDIGPKRKFTLMLIAIYVISLPVISAMTYIILKDNAVKDAYNMGKVHLSMVGAIKHYVSEELRPVFYKEMPGRFIIEGMSRSYVAGEIARRVHKEHPTFKYINASLNPMNPENAANEFEAEIINTFIRDRTKKEWRGFRRTPDEQYYVIAKAGEPVTDDCLRCHGDPSAAPRELVKKYGSKSGFNMKAGQIVDAKFIYIPIGVPLAAARKVVAIFIAIYTVFFGITFLIINARFTRLYNKIDSDSKKIDSINEDLSELNQELETLVAERTMSLMALTVADKVRNPATVIGWACKRILEKEKVSGELSETLKDIIDESRKLETIVKDFETVLKSKQSMFRFDDINGIVRAVVPIAEKEASEKGVHLSVNLSELPLKINVQKNLLRVAILHILRNAIEATPEGGRITITTSAERDNVIITISDTGSGISKEDIDRIFEPFYSTKRLRFGMGLSLVKQIVSEHLGHMSVESEQGKGTTFRITFPVRWIEKKSA